MIKNIQCKKIYIQQKKKKKSELEIESSQEVQNQHKIYRELQKIQGFYGEFGSLIRCTNKNYELACKVALGNNLDCLVVNNLQTAQIVNIVLQEKGISKEVMILQNLPEYQHVKISKTQMNSLAENIYEYIDIDIQNMKYNENNKLQTQIQNVLLYLLRGKLVTDSVEKAFELRKKRIKQIFQIITKDGNIISNDNSITSSGDKQQYLKKTIGTDKEIQQFQNQINKLEEQINLLIQQIEQIKEGSGEKEYNKLLEELQQQDHYIEIEKNEINIISLKINMIEQKQKKVSNLSQNSLEVQKYEEKIKEIENNINNVQNKICEIKQDVFMQFSNKHKIEMKDLTNNLAEDVERIFKNVEKQQLKINQIQENINQCEQKNQKTNQALKSYNENVENYQKAQEIYKEQIQEKQFLKEKENKNFKKKIEELNELKGKLQEIQIQNDEFYQELITKTKNLQKQKIQLKHSFSLLFEKKEQQIQESQIKQIFEVFQDKEIKKSQFQLQIEFQEEYGQEIGKSKIQYLIDNIDIKLLNSYQDSLENNLIKKRDEIQEYASKEITEGLLGGYPGQQVMGDDLKEKKEQLKQKLGELLSQKKEKEEKFKILKNKRKEIFDEFFKNVQNLVKLYYGELTKLPGKNKDKKALQILLLVMKKKNIREELIIFVVLQTKLIPLILKKNSVEEKRQQLKWHFIQPLPKVHLFQFQMRLRLHQIQLILLMLLMH
ncbi:smc c-terminal domain protein [Ichthyophthirius multifiliis]|uniref:Smc c-terminal domain protein n=1 Tax=Ichthyophthirius multifiliis TaxID=5932 RepID=G0QPB1_ICHMU|nr:smc c-terminal domain protein [Ichthyophthirius multifiliis]EGR32948.1 smc c-terminal domain protein [Ichthyophthirius multifiliis]|eukprot:XP_004036934.1 smc c-terminal domain protein [Ichthyophthirius multifiliis]